MNNIFPIVVVVVFVLGGLGLIFWQKSRDKKTDAASPINQSRTPPISGWTFQYGANQPAWNNGSWDFPNKDGIHYVVEPPPTALAIGKTVTLEFSLTSSADAAWGIPDTGETTPATVHLFIQRQGDNLSGTGDYKFYRWWSARTELNDLNGTYKVVAPITAEQWTSVFGKAGTANPTLFQAALSNAYCAGFTTGGCYFAGHGLYAKSGSIHFTLKSFTVA